MNSAKAGLLRRYDELLKALDATHSPETGLVRREMQAFQGNGSFQGREDLAEGIWSYWRSLKRARSALGTAYATAVADCEKAHDDMLAGQLHAELVKLAPQARLASFECLARPGDFIAHSGFLGSLARPTTAWEDFNATFELVPGLANERLVSFRSVNYPDYYLAHGDYRIRLQPYEDSDGFRQNGTFKQVTGLASATGSVSFESVNYPGFYIHARGDNLFLDKSDGSAAFRMEATFVIAEPRFKPDDSPPSPLDLRIVVDIDGKDQLQITQARVRWTHYSHTWPTHVKIGRLDWNPHALAGWNPIAISQFLGQPVDDLSTAKLTKIRGRGPVSLSADKGSVTLVFDNDARMGADTYEVVLHFGK